MRKMGITNIINRLLGYVEFSIVSIECEKFLSLIMEENLDIWAIKRIDSVTVCAKTRLVSLAEIEKLARNSGIELKITNKKGAPIFIKKYKYRYGLIAGAVVFSLFLIISSCFIWSVDISGYNSIYQKDRILEILSDNGFGIGSPSFTQDFQGLKRIIMREFKDVSYITINILGSKAEVEIEAGRVPPQIVSSSACNLVAKTDGQLVVVETYHGISEVKVGQSVKEGQLLVSGVYESQRVGPRFVHARGKVMARTEKTISVFVPFSGFNEVETGNEKVTFVLKLFDKVFEMKSPYEKAYIKTKTDSLSLGKDIYLPLEFGCKTYFEIENKEYFYDEEQAAVYAKQRLDEQERIEIKNIIVENKTEKKTITDGGIFYEYIYTIIEDIIKEQEIYRGN